VRSIETLLCSPPERARLEAAARARTFKTWAECAAEFLGWIHAIGLRR
jgi:hypothetical protein